jgi:hypothetical protein
MVDRELIDRANAVIDRLFALDDAVANAAAFRAYLEELHGRDLSVAREPHVAAIHIARAGILRGFIGATMACLDPPDWRGNRASLGQILELLKDSKVAAVFPVRGDPPLSGAPLLPVVAQAYEQLRGGELYGDGKRFRNDLIAHLLIPDEPTPTVEYKKVYSLHDTTKSLLADLYRVCDCGVPRSPTYEAGFRNHAKIFWDTYWRGMGV